MGYFGMPTSDICQREVLPLIPESMPMAHSNAPAAVLRSRTHAVFGYTLLHAAGRHAVLRIPAVCRVTGHYLSNFRSMHKEYDCDSFILPLHWFLLKHKHRDSILINYYSSLSLYSATSSLSWHSLGLLKAPTIIP